MVEQQSESIGVGVLEKVSADMQKLRQLLMRHKGRLEDVAKELAQCTGLPTRLHLVEQQLESLFQRIANIDGIKDSLCTTVGQLLEEQFKSILTDKFSEVRGESADNLELLRSSIQ